jgi:hypothetical protein
VLENRVLKRISGLNRDEVKGNRTRLYKEEFHNLYSSPNIRFGPADKEEWDVPHIQHVRWGGGVHTGLWWENEKRPLGRLRRRWKVNIKINLRFEKKSGLN